MNQGNSAFDNILTPLPMKAKSGSPANKQKAIEDNIRNAENSDLKLTQGIDEDGNLNFTELCDFCRAHYTAIFRDGILPE